MVDFGEDAMVSLGKYFWSVEYNPVVMKEYKIKMEGTFKQGSFPNHIFLKRDSSDTKQKALDTTIAIRAFAGANFHSVSQLNKEL